MAHTHKASRASAELDFESVVDRYYRSLYRFALSLARAEAEACDLVQQTFYVWANKGHQLQEASKVKTWLFTTLYREFLKARRRESRFPHEELSQVEDELPAVPASAVADLDAAAVLQALTRLDESQRAPIALFYLEEHSYREIAEILELPLGTVQSRIARGKAQLHRILQDRVSPRSSRAKV